MPHHFFALYNPALLQPDDLLAEFTVRLPMLETLLDIVRGNEIGKPLRHCLLLGARGMGKTTTLWAIAHRVNRDATLASQWQPVVFDEESRRVGDLADFWLEAIRQWELATKFPRGLADRLLKGAPADIEDQAREGFLKLVDQSGRRALLLIDNLNDVLTSLGDAESLRRLREFLAADSRVALIGGTTRSFEELDWAEAPFKDFFRCFELSPLSASEMETCLTAQARSRGNTVIEKILQERQGTVRALHLLTGGNPRLVKTFYRLLAEGLRSDIRADLERLMDEFTPYFKAIVDALPLQQQRIFDAVALAWDPVETAALAVSTRLPASQVTSHLGKLVKAGLLTEASGNPRRKTYMLADRFSNIHYLMRHGRAARNRLDWFVALVRIVFPDQTSVDVLARAAREAAEAGPEGMLDARSVLHSALARADSVADRRAVMHAALRESWGSAAWDSLDEWFDAERAHADLPEIGIIGFCRTMPIELRTQLGYQPEDSLWWHQLTSFLEEKEAWPIAEAAYLMAIKLDPKLGCAWCNLGNLLMDHLGRPSEAEAAYRVSIELDPNLPYPWNNLGNLLKDHLGRPAEAETALRKAIELDPLLAYPWNGLGNLLQDHFDRPHEAEAAYRKAIELDPKLAYPWNGLGNLLKDHLARPAEAEAAYCMAIELDPSLAYQWYNLGNLLMDPLGRLEEAQSAYHKAIELDPQLAYPWCGLAVILSQKDSSRGEAVDCATKAVSMKPDYDYARALFLNLCGGDSSAWRKVLPPLAPWCLSHPQDYDVFDFAVEGWLRFARLATPAEAMSLIDSLPDSTPFHTVRDAFEARDRRDHLQTLAPERQNLVIALLERIDQAQSAPAGATPTLKPKSSGGKS